MQDEWYKLQDMWNRIYDIYVHGYTMQDKLYELKDIWYRIYNIHGYRMQDEGYKLKDICIKIQGEVRQRGWKILPQVKHSEYELNLEISKYFLHLKIVWIAWGVR